MPSACRRRDARGGIRIDAGGARGRVSQAGGVGLDKKTRFSLLLQFTYTCINQVFQTYVINPALGLVYLVDGGHDDVVLVSLHDDVF